MGVSLDEERIKELLKQAMVELLEERKDYFYELFAEVIEDAGLASAIREGEDSGAVDRSEVFGILDEEP